MVTEITRGEIIDSPVGRNRQFSNMFRVVHVNRMWTTILHISLIELNTNLNINIILSFSKTDQKNPSLRVLKFLYE